MVKSLFYPGHRKHFTCRWDTLIMQALISGVINICLKIILCVIWCQSGDIKLHFTICAASWNRLYYFAWTAAANAESYKVYVNGIYAATVISEIITNQYRCLFISRIYIFCCNFLCSYNWWSRNFTAFYNIRYCCGQLTGMRRMVMHGQKRWIHWWILCQSQALQFTFAPPYPIIPPEL